MRAIGLFLAATLWACAAQAEDITLYSGQKTGTYYAFGRDLANYSQTKNIRIINKESDGSVDNIKRINRKGEMSLGIVQSDVLGFLSRSQNAQSKQIVSQLRVLFPFYQEEVHVLARKEITDFRDLQGKKVAIGEDGSGHMLTAVNLFAIEQIVPSEIKKIPPEEGVVAVLKGDLDAVVFVGGKPVKMFKNMEDLARPEHQKFALLLHQVHFLPLTNARFYEEYEPAEISPRDYSFVKSTLPTIAVESVLVSYEGQAVKAKKSKKKPTNPRCDTLHKFASALRASLPTLKEKGHPKWREVTLSDDVVGWKKDSCLR